MKAIARKLKVRFLRWAVSLVFTGKEHWQIDVPAQVIGVSCCPEGYRSDTGDPATHIVTFAAQSALYHFRIDQRSATRLLAVERYMSGESAT